MTKTGMEKLRKELSRAKKEITTIMATVVLWYGLLLGLYGFAIFYHFVGRKKVDFKKETITLIDIHGECKPRLIVRDAIVSNKVDPDKIIRVRTKQPNHKQRLLVRRVRKLFRTFVPRSL